MAGRLASSIFVGFVLESLLYGAFIVIFISAAVTQWERRKHEKLKTVNKLVMGFSVLLLGFISTVSVFPGMLLTWRVQVEIALDP